MVTFFREISHFGARNAGTLASGLAENSSEQTSRRQIALGQPNCLCVWLLCTCANAPTAAATAIA